MERGVEDRSSSGGSKAKRAGTGRPIPVRKMGFSFADVPRHWFFGAAVPTHVANGLNLVFPAGERFFIRSVKHYMDQLDDPELVRRVRAFFGQEGRHGFEHEQSFEMLEAQGYEIRKFLAEYEHLAYEVLEPRVPPSVRLAVTVALEHFTASLAERALTADLLDQAAPVMRDLLRWHAAEEIEHKSVAFDVFEKVDGRYSVRMVGLAIATACLLGFWAKGTRMLLAQEPGLTREEIARQKQAAHDRGQDREVLVRAFLSYLRPSFHPDDHDNYDVAARYLASVGRAEG
jgi:predicted metal-dependent hydrolase